MFCDDIEAQAVFGMKRVDVQGRGKGYLNVDNAGQRGERGLKIGLFPDVLCECLFTVYVVL